MANVTLPAAKAAEVLVTHQEFKGPNVTLMEAKNIVYVDDVVLNQSRKSDDLADTYLAAEKHRCHQLVGFTELGAAGAAADYVGSIFDKVGIGSEYKQLVADANGVVTGVKLLVKTAKAGAATDWKLTTVAVNP